LADEVAPKQTTKTESGSENDPFGVNSPAVETFAIQPDLKSVYWKVSRDHFARNFDRKKLLT